MSKLNTKLMAFKNRGCIYIIKNKLKNNTNNFDCLENWRKRVYHIII